MKSTAALLAICAIALLANAEQFDCGQNIYQVSDDASPSKTACCSETKKSCGTEKFILCGSGNGYVAKAATNDNTLNPSLETCCTASTCGDPDTSDSYQCPADKMPKVGRENSKRNETMCCEEWTATCGRTKGGNKKIRFECGAGFFSNTTNEGSDTVTKDECCVEQTTTVTGCWDFDCYASGKQPKDSMYDSVIPNVTYCCEEFESTCNRELVSKEGKFQCGEGKVYNNGGVLLKDATTKEKEAICCNDATCANARDLTCNDYPSIVCTRNGLVKGNLAFKDSDDKVCCVKPSTSSSTRRGVVYSIFILAAISALA